MIIFVQKNDIKRGYLIFLSNLVFCQLNQGILSEGGELSTMDLLLEAACFVNKVNNIFYIKRSRSN